MERLAAIDGTNSISIVEEMSDFLEPLRAMLVDAWAADDPPTQLSAPEGEDQLIIALVGLLTLAVLAAVSAERWTDSICVARRK